MFEREREAVEKIGGGLAAGALARGRRSRAVSRPSSAEKPVRINWSPAWVALARTWISVEWSGPGTREKSEGRMKSATAVNAVSG